jgi:hypothetical protein
VADAFPAARDRVTIGAMLSRALPALAVALVALAPAVALAGPSPKEKADARAFLTEARKAAKDKRWTDAIGAFQTAAGLDPSPAVELELAQTEIAAGKLAEAAKLLATINDGTDPALPAKKVREAAKKALDELKPRIPMVKVSITGPTGKVSVIIDGADVDASGEIAVNPGSHTIGASADRWNPAEKDVKLAEGAHETVELTLTSSAAAAPVESTSGSRLPGIIVASGGGLALVLGGVFGGLAFSAASSAKALCVGNACPAAAAGDISSSKTYGNVSTAMFIVGGAAAAAGVVLIIVAPGGKKDEPRKGAQITPWIGAGQAGLAGSF